jgi:hypothetical protein
MVDARLPVYGTYQPSFNRLARAAGIPGGFTSHSLRHAFVSAPLSLGGADNRSGRVAGAPEHQRDLRDLRPSSAVLALARPGVSFTRNTRNTQSGARQRYRVKHVESDMQVWFNQLGCHGPERVYHAFV